MLTINLNSPVKNLDEKEIENSQMSKIVANILISGSKGPFLKLFELANSLWKNGVMQVDQTDFEMVKNEVMNHETTSTLAKAQILLAMDEQKALHKE